VQSTLVLRRDTGVIIHAEGAISASEPQEPSAGSTLDTPARQWTADKGGDAEPQPVGSDGQAGPTKAQQLATMALRFTAVAGDLAGTLQREGDELEKVGLLRMRTGRHEVIVVPGE
jgi:hypothetical protein